MPVTMMFISAGFGGLMLLSVWPAVRDRWDERVRRTAYERLWAASRPATEEGALVAGLLRGELGTTRYRREMARLAARDSDRHPLRVPPG